MKILLVNQHPQDEIGGSEIQCDLIAKALTSLGHEVLYGVVNPGNKHYDCPYQTMRIENPFVVSYYRTLKRYNPDIIYWRFHKNHLFAVTLITKFLGIPFVFAISSRYDLKPWIWKKPQSHPTHGTIHKVVQIVRYLVSVRRSLRTLWNYLGFLLVDASTSLNPDFLHGLPVKRQTHISNSMDKECVPFTWPKPYVVWVANLKSSKNPERFIELSLLLQDMDVEFLMIGKIQDPRYQFITKTDADLPRNLCYLGPKSPEQVNGILRSSLFLVHTCTSEEGFGNNFIQAWLQGKPTVSLYFDPNSIIANNSLGYISGSMEQLARDVKHLIDAPVLRSEMGTRARDFAAQRFDINYNIKILEKFLLNIL